MKKLDRKSGRMLEFVPECSDPRYLRAMARMVKERGLLNLSQAYLLWAQEEEENPRERKPVSRPRVRRVA